MAETDGRYDVVGVTIIGGTVRIMDRDKTERTADAVMRMAVYRRGVEEEFFAVVPAGAYTDGDVWQGKHDDLPGL